MLFTLPAHKCAIRILVDPPDYAPAENWVHRMLSVPRTLTEWHRTLEDMHRPIFSANPVLQSVLQIPPAYTPSTNTVPDIWHHRAEAADQLEGWLTQNQAVRFQMRRLFRAWAQRRMDKRVIGEEGDVGTLEPVLPRDRVYIYDWSTRSKYCFHVSTLHRHTVAALRFQHMALSYPQSPKNPFTNIPWTLGQIIQLVDLLHAKLWDTGRRSMDNAVQIFQRSEYNLQKYRQVYGYQLDRDCARRFFMDSTSDYWEDIYGEMLNEIVGVIRPVRRVTGSLNPHILSRSLSKELLEAWDRLVYAYWCYANLSRMVLPNICSIYDLLDETKGLYRRTEEFLLEQRTLRQRKKVLPRARVGGHPRDARTSDTESERT